MGALYWFVGNKEVSSLEIVVPLPNKARGSFLRTRKRIGAMVDLEAAKQSTLAIKNSEREAQPR